jgi:hypothetical protein
VIVFEKLVQILYSVLRYMCFCVDLCVFVSGHVCVRIYKDTVLK